MPPIEIGTTIKGEQAIRPVCSGERAQEFANVVSRNLPMFYKRAFRFLGNAPDAEDAVQDALLSACKHFGQFRGQAQLSTWLTAIVTNAARMQLRRRRGSCLPLEQQQGEDGLTLSERLPDSRPGPEETCSTSEAHALLISAVKQLSPTLRATFQLRDIDGLTTKETACLLGVPEGTVKAQLARARAKLARIMWFKPAAQHSRTVSVFTTGTNGEPAVLLSVRIVLHGPITKDTGSDALGSIRYDRPPQGLTRSGRMLPACMRYSRWKSAPALLPPFQSK
jgi:RNA polymerase sigma-70 factor (ECF subfamily)